MNNTSAHKNLIFSLLSVATSVIQSIVFVPFIMKLMGAEAYGYIAVVMVFINIATVVSVAITTMSSRYITIELQKKDTKEANRYFNSIFTAVSIVSTFFLGIFFIISLNIESLINISPHYVSEVKILILITGLSLIISIMVTPFLAGLYYKNQLYVIYFFSILNYIFKIVIPFIFLMYDKVPIWGMSFGGLIIDVLTIFYYITYYKKNMPGVKLSKVYSSSFYIFKVLKSGIWISISKAGSLLLSNIGVYVANITISVILTGVYATIIQLQTLIMVLVTAIVNTFVPKMYQLYADGDKKNLLDYTKKMTRGLSIPLGLISGGMLVYGIDFMTLWLGTSYKSYQILLVIMIISLPFSLPAEILNQLNITINKVKTPALVTLIFGAANLALMFIFIFYFKLGIYGIAISQLIINILRGFIFFPIYTSKHMNVSFKAFYKDIIVCPIITAVTIIIAILVKMFIEPYSWIRLISGVLLVIAIILTFIFIVVLEEDEKLYFFKEKN